MDCKVQGGLSLHAAISVAGSGAANGAGSRLGQLVSEHTLTQKNARHNVSYDLASGMYLGLCYKVCQGITDLHCCIACDSTTNVCI